MKVIVDIKNKTLKMLENERSIFKGEYSADKLELYINKQLENEYPVITGLLSNGRRIGAFTTDDGYEIETIDGVEYTKAKFTLSKENGFPLSAGVTQITIWMYRTKDSVLVSKEAIGNVVFTVVDTTAFNDGDIIISGDVEGTVVNLKVELENLQQVAQINNVAINNLQNNKADKTTLNDYLKRDGSKPMTGDLDMDYYGITNTRLYDKETHNYIALSGIDIGALLFSSKSGALELRSPEMDDLDTSNFLIYPTPENTNHIAGQEYETYEWILPKQSGTIATIDDIPTKTSQLENDSNYTTQNDLKNVIKIAEGKTKTYVIKASDNDWVNSNMDEITTMFTYLSLITVDGKHISYGDLKIGDIILVKELDIPDRYVGNKVLPGLVTFYKMETTKIDLNGYALKIEIPTKVSQLDNDSGLITNAVNNLTNYYLKSETYTKSEVQQLLSTISSLKLEVVTNLPTTNISSNTIYLKPLDSAKENNIYEEYIYINSKWETIGTTAVDLTNYALKEDIPTKISELEQDVELGVNEEDVMDIIENNAEQTNTLAIGTSETFDATSDEQIPTSKAVSDLMKNAGGGSTLYKHTIKVNIYFLDKNEASGLGTKTLTLITYSKNSTVCTEQQFIDYLKNKVKPMSSIYGVNGRINKLVMSGYTIIIDGSTSTVSNIVIGKQEGGIQMLLDYVIEVDDGLSL